MACAFVAWWERNQSIASICFLKFQKQIFVFSGDHYVLSMDGLGIVVPFSFLGGESPGKKGASFYTCSASEAAVLGSVCLAACWYYCPLCAALPLGSLRAEACSAVLKPVPPTHSCVGWVQSALLLTSPGQLAPACFLLPFVIGLGECDLPW